MASKGIMIVTGGSRGIGAGIARLAGQRGYDVCVNYTAAADRAEAVAEEVRAQGARAIAVKANVAVPGDVENLFAETDRQLGPVDVLVNNAAISIETPIGDQDPEVMRRVAAVWTVIRLTCGLDPGEVGSYVPRLPSYEYPRVPGQDPL